MFEKIVHPDHNRIWTDMRGHLRITRELRDEIVKALLGEEEELGVIEEDP